MFHVRKEMIGFRVQLISSGDSTRVIRGKGASHKFIKVMHFSFLLFRGNA